MAFGPVLEPSSLDGRDGFRINGEGNRDYSGGSMSAAGTGRDSR